MPEQTFQDQKSSRLQSLTERTDSTAEMNFWRARKDSNLLPLGS